MRGWPRSGGARATPRAPRVPRRNARVAVSGTMPLAATTTRGRWLLWIAAGALALAVAAWAALAVFLPPARVHALVERQITAALAREARFQGAAVGFLPLRITVRQPELAEPGGF